MAKKSNNADPAMHRAGELFEKSGLTLDELGRRMGYEGQTSRVSVWQFLKRTTDPRLSMLRKLAKALGVHIHDLVR